MTVHYVYTHAHKIAVHTHAPNGIHTPIPLDQLNVLLHSYIELKGGVEFAQLALVVMAPAEALGGVV